MACVVTSAQLLAKYVDGITQRRVMLLNMSKMYVLLQLIWFTHIYLLDTGIQ